MRIFDALIKSILCYSAEVWGWKEWKHVERVQDKYLKWVLKVERTTPGHILHEETRRHKIFIIAAAGCRRRHCWHIC